MLECSKLFTQTKVEGDIRGGADSNILEAEVVLPPGSEQWVTLPADSEFINVPDGMPGLTFSSAE